MSSFFDSSFAGVFSSLYVGLATFAPLNVYSFTFSFGLVVSSTCAM